MITFIQSASGLMVFDNDTSHSVAKDHPNFSKILQKCMDDSSTFKDVEGLISIQKALEEYENGAFVVKDEMLIFKGRELPKSLSDRLIAILRENGDISPFYNFLENLFQNPSYIAVTELYQFLDACSLPITPDGHFLAYKKVTHDYKDIHSRTFNNTLGTTVSMNRNEVDDDRRKTCSKGLHVCSYEYLSHFGGKGTSELDDRVVICKINPKDVVSVPADYNNQKMRVCAYKVIDEIPNDGITTIMNWTYGDRKEGWIRDTLAKLREIIKKHFNIDNVSFRELFTTGLNYNISNTQRINFIDEIWTTFDFMVDFPEDKPFSLKNLLQYVSNYAAN